MKSSAATVGDYVGQLDGTRRPVGELMRAACREHLGGYQELMARGMPTYARDGQPEVAFAKQATYLSLYILKKDVLDGHRADLRDLSVGKGCIRFRQPDRIDWALVGALLDETVDSIDRPF
ncbi:MAG: DUF1801 domain-containing protein [Acidimicrobiales bacterium]|jgi:uncharacterized protein YdhG (YjbR/CyaY superfamily)